MGKIMIRNDKPVFCEECGAPLYVESMYCPKCRIKIINPKGDNDRKICGVCKEAINESASVCPYCGSKQGKQPRTQVNEVPVVTSKAECPVCGSMQIVKPNCAKSVCSECGNAFDTEEAIQNYEYYDKELKRWNESKGTIAESKQIWDSIRRNAKNKEYVYPIDSKTAENIANIVLGNTRDFEKDVNNNIYFIKKHIENREKTPLNKPIYDEEVFCYPGYKKEYNNFDSIKKKYTFPSLPTGYRKGINYNHKPEPSDFGLANHSISTCSEEYSKYCNPKRKYKKILMEREAEQDARRDRGMRY